MKREYLRVISEYLGVFPVRINSNLVSAQNRDRWYWSNIKTKDVGLFDEQWTDIEQPKDRGILLKDILQDEGEINEKYYLSDKQIIRGIDQAKGKIWKSGNKMGNMDFPNNVNKKAKTLNTVQTKGGRETNHISYGSKVRVLTPIESSIIQTIPSWYKWIVSDSQIYKLLGNGWTVEVIKHIFKQLQP